MSERLKTAGLAALLLAFFVGVPADAANREFQQLMADMRMMQEQNQQLQVLLGGVTDALKAVNSRLDDQANLERKAFADQRLLVDNLSSDLRIVREKIDDANVRIASLSQELEALRLAIPPSGAASSMDPMTGGTSPDAPAGQAPAGPVAAGQSPQRMYDTAWADYSAGQWSLAIEGFQTYLKTFPRSPLAGEAQAFIGEAYFADSKYKEALAAYDQVIQTYPTSDAVPNAYYKRGLTLERLKQLDAARESYNTVLQKYPSSSVAHLAKQALERASRALTHRETFGYAVAGRAQLESEVFVGSVNKVILVGNLGRDAELRYTPGGAAVATLNLATTEVWNDKGGQRQEKTEWHRVILWGKTAESLNEYLTKGKQIYVEGRLQTRQWEDKEGNKKYTTEVRGDRVVLLGGGGGGGRGGGGMSERGASTSGEDITREPVELTDDDIPF